MPPVSCPIASILLGLPQGLGRRNQIRRPFFNLGFEGRVRMAKRLHRLQSFRRRPRPFGDFLNERKILVRPSTRFRIVEK